MPHLQRMKLKSGPIEAALVASKRGLLPAAMLDQPLVQWILSFEGDARELPGADRADGFRLVVANELSERLLRPTVAYYHSVLMNLGPQLAAAEEGAARIQALLENENLSRSCKDVMRALEFQITEADSYELVRRFARGATEAWQLQRRLVEESWRVWLQETETLKGSAARTREHLASQDGEDFPHVNDLIAICVKPSELARHGFPDTRNLNLGPLLAWLQSSEEERKPVPRLIEQIRRPHDREYDVMATDPSYPVRRAEALYNEPLNRETVKEIESLLEQAAAQRSAFGSIVALSNYLNRWGGVGRTDLDAVEREIAGALAINPNLAAAHYAQGFVFRAKGHHEKALASFQRSVAIDPSNARGVAQAGAEHLYLGRAAEALSEVRKALELSPDSPERGIFEWIAGCALFFDGKYGEAIPWLQRSIETWSDLWYSRAYEASAYALIGDNKTAKQKLMDFIQRFPDLDSIACIVEAEKTDPNNHPFVVEGRRCFHKGLARAGMPP
jgi:tetratricopeptide (TPR) repeat protein